MVGVNVDGIDNLIKRCDLYLDSYNGNSAKLLSNLSDLQNSYSGNDLNFLFSEPINEIENIKTISGILTNYSSVVGDVKVAYQAQDMNLRVQTNRIDS